MSSNSEFVLDASALLALILFEPGHETVRAILDHCALHFVNAAEVLSRLMRDGVPRNEAVESLDELSLPVLEDFSFRMAADVGELIARTRNLGLSFGDCACIVAAAHTGATAVTAERAWKNIEGRRISGAPVKIRVIR